MTTEESLYFCLRDYMYKTETPAVRLTERDRDNIFNHWHNYFNNVLPKEDAINQINDDIASLIK